MKSGCPDKYGNWDLSPYFPGEMSPAQVSIRFIFHLRAPENTWTPWSLKSKWAVARLLLTPGVLSKMVREQAWVTWQGSLKMDISEHWGARQGSELKLFSYSNKKKIFFVNWSRWATDYFLRRCESEETEAGMDPGAKRWMLFLHQWHSGYTWSSPGLNRWLPFRRSSLHTGRQMWFLLSLYPFILSTKTGKSDVGVKTC